MTSLLLPRKLQQHDWRALDPEIARLEQEGYSRPAIADALGIKYKTLASHQKR